MSSSASPTQQWDICPPPPPPPSSSPDRELKHEQSPPEKIDILHIFRCRWYLSRANLLLNIISAQKAEDGNISWVEFTPQYHSHLVNCAIALVPHPVHMVEKALYVYALELLNGKGNLAFFDLQAGDCKGNNTKKHLEAAKGAKLTTHEHQCEACGQKLVPRETARMHKCPNSKVVCIGWDAAPGEASQARPEAGLDTPPAPLTTYVRTAPSNSSVRTAVTGGLQIRDAEGFRIQAIENGYRRHVTLQWQADALVATGEWTLGWS
jgi:hypothetical protein